ncbi:helix-turn-helix domain-containing protein [Parablautia sp. Marseille-Q6255]|uniref:helix-turn-helix domain-containing protein n=1 Tax=Parablautia sp. Marseille-Q6255 TaxID=3039593 RepID=UPI0024BCDA5C|nr:helix-turn-helix transcriptional regulator [Parablautia sp. Marseille-Q6255]
MLNENIRNLRKAKGLSQEELAIKLNVVRQTVSKWEKGLSVPDSSMLVSLAEELDTSVSALLGETIQEGLNAEDLKNISEKLEVINLQFAKKSERKIKTIRYSLILMCVTIIVIFIAFAIMNSEYLTWDFTNPELAIVGTLLHGFEFLFVRLAPFIFIGSVVGIVLTYKKR